VTIIPPPQLKQALDEAARQQGTTAESLAVALLSGLLLPSAAPAEEPPGPGESLADQLSYYIGSIDSGEYVPGGARLSERTGTEYGKLLLQRHRKGYP
jgi:hypothetical protein